METDYERWQPLHWLIEFPDVIEGHGGFDAIVGNPPFLGGKKISPAMGQNLRSWLVHQVSEADSGDADLVAYFFLRARSLLRTNVGQLGLVATNTIAQGDTREVGLDRLVSGGLTIRKAIQSAKWPARGANLAYSAVWGSLALVEKDADLFSDGVRVRAISTMLEPEGRVVGRAFRLRENKSLAFIGTYVLSAGFVLSAESLESVLESNDGSAELISPYLNGDDLNSRTDCSASRWVINFKERSESDSRVYGAAWSVVYEKVRPERIIRDAARYPRMVHEWWKYWRPREGLYDAISNFDHVLAIAIVSRAVMPVRVPTGQIFSSALSVFATDSYADQAVLSSSLHQAWAITYGSTLETRVRYTPSDVFETYPRPDHSTDLGVVGRALDEERREIMGRRALGLTKLYNLINDPDLSGDADVDRLREVHVWLDEVVTRAYGWDDVHLRSGFHTYRQMERFTIGPVARVELLDRLLEENHRRAARQGVDVGGDQDSDIVDTPGTEGA